MSRRLPLLVQEWNLNGRPEVSPLRGTVAEDLMCPSYPEWSRGVPFAYRDGEGELVFISEKYSFDELGRGDIRKYGGCITTRCAHWSDHCSLGAVLARSVSGLDPDRRVDANRCPIQDSCRWKAENGPVACLACVNLDYLMSN